jgi:hypothetical protein
MKRTSPILALLLTVALTATVLATVVWNSGTSNPTPEATLTTDIANEHNAHCPVALISAGAVIWTARYRAMDMVMLNYFDHVNPYTGLHSYDYLTRAGLAWSYTGEDIVWNSYSDDLTASEAFNQLMGSPTHKAIMDDCNFVYFGVGDYKRGTQRMYAIDFFKP